MCKPGNFVAANAAATKKPKKTNKKTSAQMHSIGISFPKPLSPDEEKHFINQYAYGNTKEKVIAKNILIEHNLRLVAHIVKKFHHPDVEDLISIGTIGLIKGICSYDPAKGTKLATYASRCIENAIYFHVTPFKEDVHLFVFDNHAL
jgi:DNA-directed RNA polymerase sigma subunit (sigma70/sigma32)